MKKAVLNYLQKHDFDYDYDLERNELYIEFNKGFIQTSTDVNKQTLVKLIDGYFLKKQLPGIVYN